MRSAAILFLTFSSIAATAAYNVWRASRTGAAARAHARLTLARRRASLSRASGEANLACSTPEHGTGLHRSERLTAWWSSEPRGRLLMCARAEQCTARWARA
jgi:hypothetical protein